MTFAEKLQLLRDSAGLTQEQLSERSGINIWTLRGYEQGRREPNWKGLIAIAAALGVMSEAFADCESLDAPTPRPRGRPPKTEAASEPTTTPETKAVKKKGK